MAQTFPRLAWSDLANCFLSYSHRCRYKAHALGVGEYRHAFRRAIARQI